MTAEYFAGYFDGADPNSLIPPETAAALSPPEPPEPPTGVATGAPAEQPGGMSRRGFIARSLVGALSVGAVGTAVVYGTYEAVENAEGRRHAEELFEHSLFYSQQLSYFDGLLEVDGSVPVAEGMFAEAVEPSPFSPDNEDFLVAVRPINVVNTILRNLGGQTHLEVGLIQRAVQDIPPGLFAFYWPQEDGGGLTYLNTDAYKGLITPLTIHTDNFDDTNTLPVYDMTINGREVQDGVAYPYVFGSRLTYQPDAQEQARLTALAAKTGPEAHKAYEAAVRNSRRFFNNYGETTTYAVIGQALNVDNAADLDAVASQFYNGVEPISLPYSPTPPAAPKVDLRSDPFAAQSGNQLP
jgi:hypothetical protein